MIDSAAVDRAVLFRLATSVRLERIVRAVPLGERLSWQAPSLYVAGTTAADALELARELHERGVGSSIDRFGELVEDVAVAERVGSGYLALADACADLPDETWLAIDLSHIGLDVDPQGCVARLAAIAERLPPGRRIQVGAEDHKRADAVPSCVSAVADKGLADHLGATVQANLRRSPRDLERLVEAGVHVRLVKGAYVEPLDRALPYGEATDVTYVRLAHRLAEAGAQFSLATHDGILREALRSVCTCRSAASGSATGCAVWPIPRRLSRMRPRTTSRPRSAAGRRSHGRCGPR